jgi:hypothetical protein
MISFMLQLLYTWRKSPQCPIDKKLGKPKNQPGHGGHVTLLTRHTQIFLQNQMLIIITSLSHIQAMDM